ncbi:hypothetical protein C8R46DRAFT_1219299 [Mycena filopes]|nr:hypothetical protein C8R46DRAFT_1219299 [Mycena filopes]
MPSLPNEHWPFRLHTRLQVTSVVHNSLSFPLGAKVCVHICGAGPNLVSLSVEGVSNTGRRPDPLEMPNVDTLRGKVDRTTSSWTIDVNISRVTIKLRFPDCQALDAFLFALSYVRLLDFIETRSPSTISLTERRLTQGDVQRFREMRASIYSRQATIAVLPVELLSKIFSFLPSSGRHSLLLPSSGHRRSAFASTLLPLWVCSEWRSTAIGTVSLWRTPPTFIFTSSFFRYGGGAQAALWLHRAKSTTVALSIKVPSPPPGQLLALLGSHPLPFTTVRSFQLVCPPSQLHSFLGHGGSALPSLEALSLKIDIPFPGIGPSYGCLQLCRSAPLLRDASIETHLQTSLRLLAAFPGHNFDLSALLPWAQLTNLSMRLRLEFSAWAHILIQCTLLETGHFVLFGDEPCSPYPRKPVTLPRLVSLRLVFRHVHDTRFFDHLALPALRHFHVGGILSGDATINFVANYVALRDLTVHLDLLGHGLQNIIHLRSPPRNIVILTSSTTSTLELASQFIETSANWIVDSVVAGCNFDLYGDEDVLNKFWLALGNGTVLEAPVGSDLTKEDGFNPWASRGRSFLRVRRRADN